MRVGATETDLILTLRQRDIRIRPPTRRTPACRFQRYLSFDSCCSSIQPELTSNPHAIYNEGLHNPCAGRGDLGGLHVSCFSRVSTEEMSKDASV